jgi:hypothetical protein
MPDLSREFLLILLYLIFGVILILIFKNLCENLKIFKNILKNLF